MYCDAVGNPPPKFQWFKEDAPILGAMDREYEKHNVSKDDNGVYKCQVYNDARQSVMSTSVHVIVVNGKLNGLIIFFMHDIVHKLSTKECMVYNQDMSGRLLKCCFRYIDTV